MRQSRRTQEKGISGLHSILHKYASNSHKTNPTNNTSLAGFHRFPKSGNTDCVYFFSMPSHRETPSVWIPQESLRPDARKDALRMQEGDAKAGGNGGGRIFSNLKFPIVGGIQGVTSTPMPLMQGKVSLRLLWGFRLSPCPLPRCSRWNMRLLMAGCRWAL